MKAEFIARVMQTMNELGWNDTESNAFIGSDTTKVNGHIESVFADAWRKAVNLLPKTYFTVDDFSNNKLVSDIGEGIGYVVLPDDFYLLYSFKMEGWHKNVETAHLFSDAMASIQSNEYTRGNFVRPVCVLSSRPVKEGDGNEAKIVIKEIMEYYSLPRGKTHNVEEALYIPIISPLSDGTQLSEKLYVPLAYLCASMVFNIFEKPEISQALEKIATEINK